MQGDTLIKKENELMVDEKRLSKMSNEEIKEISHNFCNELLRQYIDQYGLESYRLVLAGKAKEGR